MIGMPGRTRPLGMAGPLASAFLAFGLAGVVVAACGRPEAPAPRGAVSGARSAAGPEALGTSPVGKAPLVKLDADALRNADLQTETIHPAPFAVTLSVPARLNPTPETPDEVEARLAYRSAEAIHRREAADLERLRRLSSDNVVSSKSVQAAEAAFAQASIDKQRAETTLRNLGLDATHAEVFPAADLWALADVYDAQVPRVKPGARAFIRVESFPGETFEGKVVSLAAFLKPQTRTLTVRIAVRDRRHRLRPQEPATAEIQVSERPALTVPASALLYDGSERVVFIRRGEGVFEEVRVKVGGELAGRAEIIEGLAEGDAVITRNAQLLLGEALKRNIPSDVEDAGGADTRTGSQDPLLVR